MSPKKCISIVLLLVLLVTAPFSYTAYADHDYFNQFTVNQYSAFAFFGRYGMMPAQLNDGLMENFYDGVNITCTEDGSGYSCKVYDYTYKTLNYDTFPFMLGMFRQQDVTTGITSKATTPKAYNTNNRIRVGQEPIYILYFSNFNTTTNNLKVYPSNSSYPISYTRVTSDSQTAVSGNFYLICLKIWAENVPTSGSTIGYTWGSVDLGFTNDALNTGVNNTSISSLLVLPIYYGTKYTMPEDVYYYIFNEPKPTLSYDSTTYELLEEGNEESIDSVDLLDDTTDDLSDGITQLISQEDSFLTSMDTNLQNVPMNATILNNNHFLSSANWVRQQYNQMISNNPFGALLYLCLSLGLSLLILGKLR